MVLGPVVSPRGASGSLAEALGFLGACERGVVGCTLGRGAGSGVTAQDWTVAFAPRGCDVGSPGQLLGEDLCPAPCLPHTVG